MMNEIIPKYFNLEIPKPPVKPQKRSKTVPVPKFTKPDEGLGLTTRERDHLKQK